MFLQVVRLARRGQLTTKVVQLPSDLSCGRTPMATFEDGEQICREKQIA